MNRGLQVFLVCAVGAFIGTLIALQVAPWLVWLGPLIGGSFAYLAYDFQKVWQAIPRAWQAAKAMWHTFQHFTLSPETKKKAGFITLAIIFGLLWLGIATKAGLWWSVAIDMDTSPIQTAGLAVIFFACLLGTSIGIVFIFCVSNDIAKDGEAWKEVLLYVNPFSALLVMPLYGLCAGLVWLWKARARIGLALVKAIAATFAFGWHCIKCVGFFFWKFFRIIHSDVRLLCFIDAAIGAAVGFHFSNPLVGAVVGGQLGWVNFEIVSKRWLKVVPLRATI